MPGKRVYTDKEISAVLKRASELQRDKGTSDPSGLSLAELEQIAAEVGIDPAFVKTAVMELETRSTPIPGFHFWGAPLTVDLEHIVEGDLTEEKWEEIVGAIRRTYGTAGETGKLGRSKEWIRRSSTSSNENLHISVTPMDGQTRIRVLVRLANGAALFHSLITLYGSIFGLILPLVILSLAPVLEVGIGLAMAVMSFFLARWAYKLWARNQEDKAHKLMSKIEEIIGEEEETAPAPVLRERVEPTPAPASQRIDPALLDDGTGSEYAAPTARPEQDGVRRRRVP